MKWILKTIRQILMIPAFLSMTWRSPSSNTAKGGGTEMRKSTERDILRWHERGYTVAEIHRICRNAPPTR